MIICITGGIASGKTEFCSILKSLNCNVIIADNVAKEIMATNKEVVCDITREFGEESYLEGVLNRKYLADKVFNENKMEVINSIVHPKVYDYIQEAKISLNDESKNLFVESAIVFDAHIEHWFDQIALVYTPLDLRLQRLQIREQDNYESAIKRLSIQMPEEIKREKSSIIIENTGDLACLKEKAILFLDRIPVIMKKKRIII